VPAAGQLAIANSSSSPLNVNLSDSANLVNYKSGAGYNKKTEKKSVSTQRKTVSVPSILV
jgi:hypothetical protein